MKLYFVKYQELWSVYNVVITTFPHHTGIKYGRVSAPSEFSILFSAVLEHHHAYKINNERAHAQAH